MKPNPSQRKHLQSLVAQRRQGVSAANLVIRHRGMLLGHFLVILGGVAYLTQGPVWQCVGCILVGLAAGSFLRFVRSAAAVARFWPVTREIIDWHKVESLLRDDDTAA